MDWGFELEDGDVEFFDCGVTGNGNVSATIRDPSECWLVCVERSAAC